MIGDADIDEEDLKFNSPDDDDCKIDITGLVNDHFKKITISNNLVCQNPF